MGCSPWGRKELDTTGQPMGELLYYLRKLLCYIRNKKGLYLPESIHFKISYLSLLMLDRSIFSPKELGPVCIVPPFL